MATYHICDLCGKDLKNDDKMFRIIVSPEILYRNIYSSQTSYANKEVCKGCANAISNLLNEIDMRKYDYKKPLSIGMSDFEYNSEFPTTTYFQLGRNED